MARRAGFINELRQQSAPLLLLSGPDEFLADADIPLALAEAPADASSGKFTLSKRPQPPPALQGKIQPTREQTTVALRAVTRLGVDAGWLSPEAEASFRTFGDTLPRGFHTVSKAPVSVIEKAGTLRVGIVFLPRAANDEAPAPQQIDAAIEAAQALRKQCDLVIGVAPWGITGEKQLLLTADGAFDCLFGGGDGVGFSHALLERAPTTLWLRSESKGKALTLLELHQIPRAGAPVLWQEDANFSARSVYLGPDIREDPAMRKIIGYPSP